MKKSGVEKEDISNDDLFNISSWGVDFPVRELVTRYKENTLIKPPLQRKYVWKPKEASRFIDSILLGLPVPSIFLAKVNDVDSLIVDGYQRIMTVHDFIEGQFSDTKKPFKLDNSNAVNPKWRNKTFEKLASEEQKRILYFSIHAIIFEQKKPANDSGMYQIFERINTGGQTLEPQEIRNCIYCGIYNDLLMDLNKNEDWRKLLGSEQEDKRMEDVECVLRFFAMNHLEESDLRKNISITLKTYLNTYMEDMREKCKNSPELLDEVKEHFEEVMSVIYRLFGENAFRNVSTSQKKTDKFSDSINMPIFDAICVSTSYVIRKSLVDLKKITLDESTHLSLLNDEEFKSAISTRTTNTENIKKRINRACEKLYGVSYDW